MKGQRFRLKSVLGQHSDHDRPALRAFVAQQLPRRGKNQDTNPATLAKRQRETNLTVQKSLAANMTHVKQGQEQDAV